MVADVETVEDLVNEAGRRAVSRIAPDELPFYDQVAEQRRRHSSPPGSAVGFGIEVPLISEIVLQVIESALSDILVLGAAVAGTGVVRWVRRRRSTTPGLTAEQAASLRETLVQAALDRNLDREQADQLAEAVLATVSGIGEK